MRTARNGAIGISVAAIVAIAGCHRDDGAPAPEAATPAPVVVTAPPVETHVAAGAAKIAATPPPAEAHVDADPSAACLAKTNGAPLPSTLAIHRWVDAAGITHYSDTAPTTAVSAHRVLEVRDAPPVAVEARAEGTTLPSDLEHRAIGDALAVQHVFRDTLGIAATARTTLKIVFAGDTATYARLIGDAGLANSTGAYVSQQRTIYVRMPANEELAFAVLRHEIAHALIHEEVGNLPVALNEGLAEYFRRFHAAGLGGQVDVGADRDALVAAAPAGDGGDALVELLALAGADFYTADRERRYVEAYALAALLLSDPGRIAAFRAVLDAQRADPCVPVAAETVLDAHYPGGLEALAADWAAFMRAPPASVRAY